MKIIRFKDGMLRAQCGTWFNAGHFSSFHVDEYDGKYLIIASNVNRHRTIGEFDTREEAQKILDELLDK